MTKYGTSLATPILVAMVGILALSGCSSSDSSPSAIPEVSVSATPSISVEASPTIDDVDLEAKMEEFVSAVYGRDLATAETMVVPDSPAEKYVSYLKSSDAALMANGDFNQQAEANTPDLEFEVGSVTAHYPGVGSYTWSDFEFDENGLVTSWTTPSGQLSDVLWSRDSKVEAGGNSVELLSAYKTNAGELYVVLKVTAGSEGVESLLTHQAQFIASDGIAYTAQTYSTPRQSLPSEAAGYVLLTFPQVAFGGTLYLEGYNDGQNYETWSAEIQIS